MKIIVSNDIRIINPNNVIIDFAENNLVLQNPDFYKKEKMGKWTGGTPKTISLYELRPNEIILPFGVLEKIWLLHPYKVDYEYKIKPIQRIEYKSGIIPYPYQERAINAVIQAKNGVLVMPCGSGKTQVGLEAVARIGGRCLWLTHTQDLLNQSKKRAESVFERCGFGTITAGKVNIGSHITFATVQTMSRLDLSKYRDLFDVVIVDESQHCCGSPTKVTQFYKVVSSLSARYKIGLTATPKRADGLEKSMFYLLGDKIHEVTREEVKDTTCLIKVQTIYTEYQPDLDKVLCGDGTIDYTELINDLVDSEERRQTVQNIINNLDGSAIILGNRVAYISQLCRDFPGRAVCLSTLGQSKKAKEERKEALRKLNNEEIDAIFATYLLAKEGLDCPNLRYVVFATPEKDETTIIQSVGRVGRKADGKDYGTVIDLVDDFGMYYGWAKKRKRFYKKIGAEIL